jgi:hypothetical protein
VGLGESKNPGPVGARFGILKVDVIIERNAQTEVARNQDGGEASHDLTQPHRRLEVPQQFAQYTATYLASQ